SKNWCQKDDTNTAGPATWLRLAHLAEELPEIAYEELGLLHRGEVAAARHVGPAHDVVAALDPRPREPQHLFGVAGDARRHRHRHWLLPAVHVLPVQTRRRRDRPGHPVHRDVRQ